MLDQLSSYNNCGLSDKDIAKEFDYTNDAFDDVTEDDYDPELDDTREEEEEEEEEEAATTVPNIEDELDIFPKQYHRVQRLVSKPETLFERIDSRARAPKKAPRSQDPRRGNAAS